MCCALFFVSCSARQAITLQAGGAGTARLSVQLHPVFMAYYADLASGFSSDFDSSRPRFFNPAAIREALAKNGALKIVSLDSPSPGSLELEVRIQDISLAIRNQNPAARSVLSRTQNGERETLRIYLDKNNFASLLALVPEADSPAAKMLLPPPGSSVTEDEYIEHLAWALEDYAKGEDIKNIVRSAVVELSVKTPGKIISQTGGTVRGESEVVFKLPVTRLFTLTSPVQYSVSY
ncbi:MAG: hypothetical protein LBC67_06120 [Spirochaetales bacterium]|nr:hypothetical protein [Spirochaetales bacterium]